MKKIIALLLAMVLLLSVLPASFAAQQTPQNPEQDPDVWAVIEQIEDNATASTNARSMQDRTAAYNAAVDEIIEAVENSSDYVPGTLERHGNFFFWIDADGDPNGYSPSLRARQRAGAIPGAEAEDFAEIETVSYAVKGGSAGSMDIAAFQPYIGIDSSFTAQYENRCKALAQATGGTGTTYKTTQATISNIGLALSTCGVVIFDSHGTTDYEGGTYYDPDYTSQANSSYLCLTSGTGITAQDKQSAQGAFGTYYHAFQSGSTWCIDGTAMQNHMTTDSPNGMLWMAICLGMATDGLQAPLRAKGLEVVYGYSQSVSFTGDYRYDELFWPYMCSGHNVAQSASYMKNQYSNYDTYTNPRAYPIFVSTEDAYPGHGNVDKVQTVYSTWTIFPQYTVTAVSNNSDWGTVTLRGNTITAIPAEGYYIDGFEILEGEANVTQDGSQFTVDPLSDCTIQIIFAPKIPAQILFSTPEGVTCESMNAYVNEEIVLPEPTGEPTANGHTYRFLGWATAPVTQDTMELPVFVKAGGKLKITEAETTVYALYTYFVADNGIAEDQFVQVQEAPASWAGEYVITYQGQYALDASGRYTGTSIGAKNAVVDLEAIGCVKDEDSLSGVQNEIIYVIAPSDNGTYTVKMKDKNYYLALSGDSNSLTTYSSSNTNKTRWIITMGESGPILTNAEYTNRWLQYDDMFRCYSSAKNPLTLYTKADGTTWYTTEPKDKVECDEHSFGDWIVDIEPSCTEAGRHYHICTNCGIRENETLPPLGHDYVETVKEPSCTESGYTTHTCSRCGDTFIDHEVSALDHDFGEWTVTIQPTCTEPGVRVKTCSRCDAEEEETLQALGHDYQPVPADYTVPCTEPKYAEYICSRCHDSYTELIEEPSEHEWDEGVVTEEPTMTSEGLCTYTCVKCGETRTETIPMLVFRFDDVQNPDAYYYDAVYWAVAQNPAITNGTSATTFSPDNTCTRAEVVTFLYRAAGAPEVVGGENPFTDVPAGSWYEQAVLWAVANHITTGTSATTFSPDVECSRSQVVTFLYRAAGSPEVDHDANPFSDVKPNSWFANAVLWAVQNGITRGSSNTTFSPDLPCSRGQVVTFLYRAEPILQ